MDQQIRPKRGSILKRQSTFDKPNYMEEKEKIHQQQIQQGIEDNIHVQIDSSVKIITIPEEPQQTQIGYEVPKEHDGIHLPKQANNMTEAELIKLALKKPQIFDDDDQ